MSRILLVLCALLLAPSAWADSWAMPTAKSYASRDGHYRLTIYPRGLAGQLAYFEDKVAGAEPAGQQAGGDESCLAELERLGPGGYETVWQRPLINDVSPVSALVDVSGAFVTFDNWFSKGYGNDVIVIYDADGNLVRSLALTELLGEHWFEALPRSVSSIWWGGEHKLEWDGRLRLLVVESRPRQYASGQDYEAASDEDDDDVEQYVPFVLDLKTGQVLEQPPLLR
ncbi:MAG: hypothetical protein KDI51_07060 [Xanthomonadales bacterium]|nr:hypothetical protein [Xanthomonadales bacterium]